VVLNFDQVAVISSLKNKIIKAVHIVTYKALFKPLFLVGESNNVKGLP